MEALIGKPLPIDVASRVPAEAQTLLALSGRRILLVVLHALNVAVATTIVLGKGDLVDPPALATILKMPYGDAAVLIAGHDSLGGAAAQ